MSTLPKALAADIEELLAKGKQRGFITQDEVLETFVEPENYLEELEKEAIMKALEETRYNKTAAAEKLGISFRALRYRLKKLGID